MPTWAVFHQAGALWLVSLPLPFEPRFRCRRSKARFEREGEGDQPEGTSLVKNSPGGYEPLSIFAVDLLLLNYRLEGLCDMTFVTWLWCTRVYLCFLKEEIISNSKWNDGCTQKCRWLGNNREKNQPLVVPTPVDRLIIFDTERREAASDLVPNAAKRSQGVAVGATALLFWELTLHRTFLL